MCETDLQCKWICQTLVGANLVLDAEGTDHKTWFNSLAHIWSHLCVKLVLQYWEKLWTKLALLSSIQCLCAMNYSIYSTEFLWITISYKWDRAWGNTHWSVWVIASVHGGITSGVLMGKSVFLWERNNGRTHSRTSNRFPHITRIPPGIVIHLEPSTVLTSNTSFVLCVILAPPDRKMIGHTILWWHQVMSDLLTSTFIVNILCHEQFSDASLGAMACYTYHQAGIRNVSLGSRLYMYV